MRRTSLVATLVGGLLIAGSGLAEGPDQAAPAWPDHPSALALLEVFDLIRSNYISPDVDETALWQGAVAGMVSALQDRWSSHQAPAVAAAGQMASSSYTGIGMYIHGLGEGVFSRTVVGEVLPGGPAARSA